MKAFSSVRALESERRRFKNKKKVRCHLRIGKFEAVLTRRQALALFTGLDHYLMDTAMIPVAEPDKK